MMKKPPGPVLFVGGCRSGKSRLAEQFVADHAKRPCYVATMMVGNDPELRERIEIHRRRRGRFWRVLEEPRNLCAVLTEPDADVVLIDCLSMWLTNLLLADLSDQEIGQQVAGFIEALNRCPVLVVMVANEVGLGIVPDSCLGRRFRDLAGWLNQQVAEVSRRVVLVAAGLPLTLKDD